MQNVDADRSFEVRIGAGIAAVVMLTKMCGVRRVSMALHESCTTTTRTDNVWTTSSALQGGGFRATIVSRRDPPPIPLTSPPTSRDPPSPRRHRLINERQKELADRRGTTRGTTRSKEAALPARLGSLDSMPIMPGTSSSSGTVPLGRCPYTLLLDNFATSRICCMRVTCSYNKVRLGM